ncbi:MAG: acetyl-CoA C-acyltransferase [Desulfuromonadales bacterium]|nr:acetyl-CoA C-acyltransferase [Desulfuromonadales bacterium]
MEKVYLVEALRTPFGSFGGCLADVPATKLASLVIEKLLEKTGLSGEAVDQVIAGQVITSCCKQGPARQAMRGAGIPDTTGALTVNKLCGSGLKAIMLGADAIRLGDSDVVIAGGMENMSQAPYGLPYGRYGMGLGDGKVLDLLMHDGLSDPDTGRAMGVLAQDRADAHGFSREAQDEFAVTSYKRAQRAIESGLFDAEIVPVVKSTRKGDVIIDKDEEPFRVNLDRLASLRPVFAKDGTITAANASTINDGASFVLLVSEAALEKYGLKPKARLVSYSTNSLHPDMFPDAPVGAIESAIKKAGLKLEDIGRFEINEAFAAVTMIALKDLGITPEKVNVNGGAVSIGHPIGASGGRLIATLIPELERSGERYGLATLCIGGGEAVAAGIEKI